MNGPYYVSPCLCYYDGTHRHTPDACPVHGWRENPTPERIAECRRDLESHRTTTEDKALAGGEGG